MYSVFCILYSVFCILCAGVFVVEATPDTEVDVEASTAQDDEDNDGYGYGGEMITDTRPLRARAHRPRQAVAIRRDHDDGACGCA